MMSSNTKDLPLWFCCPSVSPEKIISATAGVEGPIHWVFFSQDFIKFKHWEKN